MKRMYDEKEVRQIALDSIGAYYDVDDLRFENQVTFDENVVIDGELFANGEKVGPKVILNYARPVSISSSECLQFNANNFETGTYSIQCSDDGSNLDFAGVLVLGEGCNGFCTNYDSLYGEVIKCYLFYEENKINIQFLPLDSATPISLDEPLNKYIVKLVKIA